MPQTLLLHGLDQGNKLLFQHVSTRSLFIAFLRDLIHLLLPLLPVALDGSDKAPNLVLSSIQFGLELTLRARLADE